MYLAGLLTIAFVALVIYLLVRNVDAIPQPALRVLGYFLIFGGSIELLFVFWVLGYVAVSDWSLWDLSFDDFWKRQLPAIYFIKEWLYSWFWNDLLNFIFVFLPAIVFLSVRTTITTALGLWALAASRR